MCGILCCLSPTDEKLISFTDRLEKIKHRGPDETNVVIVQSSNLTTFTCGVNRLAIKNVLNGKQPIESKEWVHVHDGEIYNQKKRTYKEHGKIYYDDFAGRLDRQVELNEEEFKKFNEEQFSDFYEEFSDSYMLNNMIVEEAISFPQKIDGIFAYCSYHKDTETLYVARDRFGVIPLYYVIETDHLATANDDQVYERIWFASEAKALIGLGEIRMFPPNNLMVCGLKNKNGTSILEVHMETHEIHPPFPTKDYYEPRKNKQLSDSEGYSWNSLFPDDFFIRLIEAVEKRTQIEVPWASTLRGLDSTIVSTLLWRSHRQNDITPVKTFSIGLQNSKEFEEMGFHFPKYGVSFQGMHHTIIVTVEEALEVIPDVVWTLETYDVTTIRAGVMNYLLAKKMKTFGTKVVYTGDGSDEIFGGNLCFHDCTSPEQLQNELKRKLNELCYYDCLRCNKAFAAFGIECRVPFLDVKFVTKAMKMNPMRKLHSTFSNEKRPEKYILRKNFQWHLEEVCNSECSADYKEIIEDHDTFCWRQKYNFSDSVGKEWIEGLIQEAEKCVTDAKLAEAEKVYPFQTPKTKEAYWYRKIFEDLFSCSGEHFVKYDNSTINTIL